MLDALLLVSTAAFIVTGGIVGIRLLRLAARTRELSDFLVGFALFDLAAVAYPLILLGTQPDLSLGGAKLISTLSMVLMALGWATVFLFTQRVFRPGEKWAMALAAAGMAMVLYGLVGGLSHVQHAVDRAALRSPVSSVMWMQYASVMVYAWSAAEGFRCWVQARRRLRLGLADPMVVNRFLLWGCVGIASLISIVPSLVITLAGGDAFASVPARLCTAFSGVFSSLSLQLAFLPPAAYRRWVTGSAAGASA
jgi:hypothetical protein